jgi:hypothetical protein
MTGMKPMRDGPISRTPTVVRANMKPAKRLFPPDLMNKTLLVYTK